jgi:hypothetical protein|nr:MAG TPA: Heme exporter protein D (CcmD) [Caudoviricetes sp.]
MEMPSLPTQSKIAEKGCNKKKVVFLGHSIFICAAFLIATVGLLYLMLTQYW